MTKNSTLSLIQKGEKKALEQLYISHKSEFVQWLQGSYGASETESIDIYQDTIIAMYENIVRGKLKTLDSSIKTYLFAIGKNKYLSYQRGESKKTELSVIALSLETEDNEPTHEEELSTHVAKKIEELGTACQKILQLYYFDQLSIREIAEKLGYKNEDTAKNQKYKCMQKLRKLVKPEIPKNSSTS